MFKVFILILLALVILSLFDSLWILFRDNGRADKNNLLMRLIIRASLALSLVLAMSWGFYTGKLQANAPWSAHISASAPYIK